MTRGGIPLIISLADLLEGIVDFPDELTRYVTASTNQFAPIFVAGDFTMSPATTSADELTCAPYPVIAGAAGGWIAVAVPSSIGLPHLSIGEPFNSGLNLRVAYEEQAGNPIAIDSDGDGNDEDYDVWVSKLPQILGARNICFRVDAVLP